MGLVCSARELELILTQGNICKQKNYIIFVLKKIRSFWQQNGRYFGRRRIFGEATPGNPHNWVIPAPK